MILTLTQTVQRAKSGEKSAYSELYAYYYKDMYRYALYALRHEQDAEDAVAETVACAYAQLRQLKNDEAFPMWLFRILSNQIKRKKKAYVEEKKTLPLEEIGDLEDKRTSQDEERVDLYQALDRLNEKDRTIIILSVIEGFTGNEVAQILNMKPATVRSRSSRAIKQLKQILSVSESDKTRQKGETQ